MVASEAVAVGAVPPGAVGGRRAEPPSRNEKKSAACNRLTYNKKKVELKVKNL